MLHAAFDPDTFSLLFPAGEQNRSTALPASTIKDLRLDETVRSLTGNDLSKKAYFEKILYCLPQDRNQILARQDILDDFQNSSGFADTIRRIIPNIEALNSLQDYFVHSRNEKRSLLHSVSWRLSILENYILCLDLLQSIDTASLKSKLLISLVEYARYLGTLDVTKNCCSEIPKMRKKIENVRSFSIGINLNGSHNPSQVTLLAINDKQYEKNGIVKKIFGDGDDPVTDNRIFSLYKNDADYPPVDDVPGEAQVEILKNMNKAMRPLFDQISKLMRSSLEPLDAALRKYAMVNTAFLCNIRHELHFFMTVNDLFNDFTRQGHPVCKPVIREKEAKVLCVRDGYSLNLVLRNNAIKDEAQRGEIVCNDIRIDEENRIGILTGPNQGGKTTYLETVGIIQVLGQTGLFVPGSSAEISIADSIFTHYQEDEKPDTKLGRFGEEAVRLKGIMDLVTPYSFVMMNESFSSTHAGEAFYIAKDIIVVLKKLGVSVLFSTHLHSLAEQADSINTECRETADKVISLVSEVQENQGEGLGMKRTFKIVKSLPKGKSYATDIAKHYKIDFESLIASQKEKNAL